MIWKLNSVIALTTLCQNVRIISGNLHESRDLYWAGFQAGFEKWAFTNFNRAEGPSPRGFCEHSPAEKKITKLSVLGPFSAFFNLQFSLSLL